VARRSLTTVAVAVVALVAFSGAATAAGRNPQVAVDPADQAWAQSIVLAASDFGTGWKSVGSGGTPSIDGAGGAGDSSCAGFAPDFSDLTITGDESSPYFVTSSGSFASSEAVVWSTPEQPQADWDRTNQPAILSCFAAALESGSTKKVKIRVVGSGALAFPSVAPRTSAYRLRVVSTVKIKVEKRLRAIKIGGTLDVVLLGSGRVGASVIAYSLDPAPLGDAFEQQLATTVAGRLSADPHA
jgi:hypothetical protein